MTEPPPSTPPKNAADDAKEGTTLVGHFFHHAERFVYILVATMLLLSALATCGYALVNAYKEMRGGVGQGMPALFALLSDLLLVLIIMELLRTVGRFIRKSEPGVGVADLTPFLIVGAISATRRLLGIGANLSITESHNSSQAKNAGEISAAFEPEHFRQAMIELGVNGGLILVITLCLLMIGKYLQPTEEMAKGDEEKER